MIYSVIICPNPDSNRGHSDLQSDALPTELLGLEVGPTRFERMTSAMSRRRHNQLDHEPLVVPYNVLFNPIYLFRYLKK